jgi:hypothetical protein
MKHGTAIWVLYPYRTLLGYGYWLGTAACVPQAYPLFSKKNISRYRLGTGRAESCQNYVVFLAKIIRLSQSLSLDISLSATTLSLNSLSLSHIITILTTKQHWNLLYKLIGEAERFFFVFSQTCHIKFTYSHSIPNLMPHFPF